MEIISNEADRLSNLVNNVLELSHIDAGNLTLSKKLHQIDDLIKNGVSRTYSDQKDQIQINLDDELPAVYVDSQRIEAVIRNLVENAIKYSGNPAVVKISSTQKNGSVVVKVEDNGPGIPEQQQDIVFNSFYRLENELSRRVQGAGLGLAICKGFIKAHGGEIWVEPKEHGTCIAFSIPLTDFNDVYT